MIRVRATTALVGFPRGRLLWVDETDPYIQRLISALLLVPTEDDPWVVSDPGGGGSGLPSGGSAGEFLRKVSGTDGDADWDIIGQEIATGNLVDGAVTEGKVNPGGSEGQLLGIDSGLVAWVDPPSGGGGGDPALGGVLEGTASAAEYVDGSIDTADIADSAITGAKIAAAIKDPTSDATPGLHTLGSSPHQAMPGDRQFALSELADVDTTGGDDGDVLSLQSGQWVPLPGSGGALVLDDLTDVAGTTASANGKYLGKTGGSWGPVDPPVGVITLDGLSDVNTPAPGAGTVLTFSGGEWIAAPGGTGAVTWFDFPENYGAIGDATTGTTITGVSVTAGAVDGTAGHIFTFAGQSVTAPQMAAATYIVQWKVPGGVETAQLKTRLSNTTFALAPVGNAAGTYTALNTVSGVRGVRWTATSASSGLAADTVGWQGAATAAKTNNIPIGVKPGKRYAITTSIDCSATKSFKVVGLAGRSYAGSGPPEVGGCYLFACSSTPITAMLRCSDSHTGLDLNPTPATAVNLATDPITHTGAHIENIGFHDPMSRNVHGGLKTRYQTRVRIYNNHFGNLGIAHRHESGSRDGSWGDWRDNTFFSNLVGIDFYNTVMNGQNDPTGAMANNIAGGQIQVFQNQTGIQWWGGQYGTISNIKFDMDDPGSCCLRFKGGVAYPADTFDDPSVAGVDTYGAGTSPSASKITVSGCRVEATGSTMDATSIVFDVERGTGQIDFVGCWLGGSGGSTGVGIRMGVAGGSGVTDHVHIIGGNIINRAVDVQFGPGAKGCKAIGTMLGGNAKFCQWDSGATDCQLLDCEYDTGTNPLLDSAKLDFGTAGVVRPWIRGVTWNTGACDSPAFNGAPSVSFGFDGAHSYNVTTGKAMVKVAGAWQTISSA